MNSVVREEFFDLLTKNMVESLGADGGGIGYFDPETKSIHSLSFDLDGRRMDYISYQLAGTPCQKVMKGSACIFERNARRLSPTDPILEADAIEDYAGIPLLAAVGDEAVAIYATQRDGIGAVIADMMMPGMDGATTILSLMEINPEVHIIATSGIVANKELAHAAGAGVRMFLAKPCSAESLLNSLPTLLSGKN